MPKKVKQTEVTEVYEDVEQPESTEETPEPEVKISKRTGKPLRPMTEKQKENLAKGRVLAVQRRKEMVEGIDLKKRAENIKKAKEDLHNAKIANHKKSYEDAIKDDEVEAQPKKEKKVIKKVIKYVEESSSDSEEEEEIIIKKKKKNKQKEEDLSHQILRQKLKTNLDEVKSNSMQQLMMPSYF
jgi:hypothetical protein